MQYKAGFDMACCSIFHRFIPKCDIWIHANSRWLLWLTEKNHETSWLHSFNIQGFEKKGGQRLVGFSKNSIHQNWISIEASWIHQTNSQKDQCFTVFLWEIPLLNRLITSRKMTVPSFQIHMPAVIAGCTVIAGCRKTWYILIKNMKSKPVQ